MTYSFSVHGFDDTALTWFIVSEIISVFVSMAITALIMVSSWHIFKKLGMPGWKGLIPYYSDYMLFKTVWKTKPFWVLIISSGVYLAASIVTVIMMTVMLAVNAGSGGENAIIPIIIVFSVIFGLLTLAIMAVGIIITVKLNLRLARPFGKGTGFALGLTFISPVFYPILAFGKAQRVT